MTNTASNQLITQADRSVKAVVAATATLSKVAAELAAQSSIAEVLAADIQQKESQLNALADEFDLQLRTQKAKLQVAVLEDSRSVLAQLMAQNHLATITDSQLTALQAELAAAKADNAVAIDAAVKAASSALHAKYNGEAASLKSAHQVEQATTTAQLNAAGERITFLTGEIESLRRQVASERDARVEIAKADSARQGVTVNTSGK